MSDFCSYAAFVTTVSVAFPQIPYSFVHADGFYYIIFRKDVLIKYLIYNDFLITK